MLVSASTLSEVTPPQAVLMIPVQTMSVRSFDAMVCGLVVVVHVHPMLATAMAMALAMIRLEQAKKEVLVAVGGEQRVRHQ